MQMRTFGFPLGVHHDRESVNHHIEKTADHQTQQPKEGDAQPWTLIKQQLCRIVHAIAKPRRVGREAIARLHGSDLQPLGGMLKPA